MALPKSASDAIGLFVILSHALLIQIAWARNDRSLQLIKFPDFRQQRVKFCSLSKFFQIGVRLRTSQQQRLLFEGSTQHDETSGAVGIVGTRGERQTASPLKQDQRIS
jgi:hypothetical protein